MRNGAAVMEMPSQGRRTLLIYGLLWCLGLYLRLTVLIVPPLIPQLKAALGFSSGEVAIATSLPLVTLALGGLAAGWLLARLGVKACMLGGLVIMAVGSALRSLPEAFLPFMMATILMGAGIACMQAAMPVLAKLWAPQRIGRASAVYTNGLLVGELLAAGATAPLADAWLGGHWQWAFALWVLPVPLLMLALTVGARSLPALGGGSTAAGLVLPDVHDGRMWRLVENLVGLGLGQQRGEVAGDGAQAQAAVAPGGQLKLPHGSPPAGRWSGQAGRTEPTPPVSCSDRWGRRPRYPGPAPWRAAPPPAAP